HLPGFVVLVSFCNSRSTAARLLVPSWGGVRLLPISTVCATSLFSCPARQLAATNDRRPMRYTRVTLIKSISRQRTQDTSGISVSETVGVPVSGAYKWGGIPLQILFLRR